MCDLIKHFIVEITNDKLSFQLISVNWDAGIRHVSLAEYHEAQNYGRIEYY